MNWYLQVLKKYAVFSGRARRREYWMFVLVSLIIVLVLTAIERATGLTRENWGILTGLYSLAVLLPSLGVTVRRLHDVGRSGWWQLIGVVPLIGWIALLVFMVQEGQPGVNAYGPNPRETPAA